MAKSTHRPGRDKTRKQEDVPTTHKLLQPDNDNEDRFNEDEPENEPVLESTVDRKSIITPNQQFMFTVAVVVVQLSFALIWFASPGSNCNDRSFQKFEKLCHQRNLELSSCFSILLKNVGGTEDYKSKITSFEKRLTAAENMRTKSSDSDQKATDADRKATDADQKATDADRKATDADQKATDADRKATDADKKATDADKKATDASKKATDADKKATDADRKATDADRKATDADNKATDADRKATDADRKASEAISKVADNERFSEERHAGLEKSLKEIRSQQEKSDIKMYMSDEMIDQLRNNDSMYKAGLFMTMFSILCSVMTVVLVLKKGNSQLDQTLARSTPARSAPRQRDHFDVYELAWSGPMENSVCVVAFHSETERRHLQETRSVFESAGDPLPKIHTRVVRSHNDIKELPGSKVCMVFVDFNERNVILEDPAKGLGNLRVSTVRSLWNFGADVTVIYCRDQGSRNLGPDLFNRDLTSIFSHPELSILKNKERMLSIFEGLSDRQKQHCRDFINRQLKRA